MESICNLLGLRVSGDGGIDEHSTIFNTSLDVSTVIAEIVTKAKEAKADPVQFASAYINRLNAAQSAAQNASTTTNGRFSVDSFLVQEIGVSRKDAKVGSLAYLAYQFFDNTVVPVGDQLHALAAKGTLMAASDRLINGFDDGDDKKKEAWDITNFCETVSRNILPGTGKIQPLLGAGSSPQKLLTNSSTTP